MESYSLFVFPQCIGVLDIKFFFWSSCFSCIWFVQTPKECWYVGMIFYQVLLQGGLSNTITKKRTRSNSRSHLGHLDRTSLTEVRIFGSVQNVDSLNLDPAGPPSGPLLDPVMDPLPTPFRAPSGPPIWTPF